MTDQTAVPCNAAQLHRPGDLLTTHGPHEWILQPDMDPVHCPGTPEEQPALTDTPATDQNRQFLTTLANLGVATHRLDLIRDAARLHRQQLIGTSELYAVIEADSPASPASPAPATNRDGEELAKRVARAIWALKSPPPPGSQHYRSGWDDGLEAAIDAARDALAAAVLPAPDQRAAVLREAADELGRMDYDTDSNDYGYDTYRDAWNGGVLDGAALLRGLAGEAQQDERCTRCTHPKRDHDGRADHRAKYSPLVAGEPWCHACNAQCDYTGEAQQDPTQDGEEARPSQHAWRVETRDPLANEWAPGSHFASRPLAVERYETANRIAPLWRDGTPVERRIVRETTTYTVEQPTAVARSVQPETD